MAQQYLHQFGLPMLVCEEFSIITSNIILIFALTIDFVPHVFLKDFKFNNTCEISYPLLNAFFVHSEKIIAKYQKSEHKRCTIKSRKEKMTKHEQQPYKVNLRKRKIYFHFPEIKICMTKFEYFELLKKQNYFLYLIWYFEHGKFIYQNFYNEYLRKCCRENKLKLDNEDFASIANRRSEYRFINILRFFHQLKSLDLEPQISMLRNAYIGEDIPCS